MTKYKLTLKFPTLTDNQHSILMRLEPNLLLKKIRNIWQSVEENEVSASPDKIKTAAAGFYDDCHKKVFPYGITVAMELEFV